MLEKNEIYMGKVIRIKKNGDGVVILPKEMCKKHGFMPGDGFDLTVVDMEIVMTTFVRLSRLKREWNKYMRRMEDFDIAFEVIRANKNIGKLNPSESKYHIKQFDMKR